MDTLYTIVLAIIFILACGYVVIKLESNPILVIIWSFLMVPILSLKWFPSWVLIFWLSFSIYHLFGSAGKQVYNLSPIQRKYGKIADTLTAVIFGVSVIDFVLYLFR